MTTTLMILAGCKGAGKSSLLDMAYRQNIALFGADCAALLQAHNPGRYPEQKIFIDALNWQTHFQGRHIPSLRELPTLPPTMIIHLDLYRLLTTMAWRISEDGASLSHLKIRIPRSDTDLLNIAHNDAHGPEVYGLCPRWSEFRPDQAQAQMRVLRQPPPQMDKLGLAGPGHHCPIG
ncbi:MAG: hypothetical protein GC184_06225 [Rhizobiales bacterium]|nr:hypothetical protein [Hyphomicrobiales bacterium]